MKIKKIDQFLAILTLSPVEKYITENFFSDELIMISTAEHMQQFIKLAEQNRKEDKETIAAANLTTRFTEFMNSKKRNEKRFYLIVIDSSRPGNDWWGGCKVESVILKYKDGEVHDTREEIIKYLYYDGSK